MSKGSNRRPTDEQAFSDNFDSIFGIKPSGEQKKAIEPLLTKKSESRYQGWEIELSEMNDLCAGYIAKTEVMGRIFGKKDSDVSFAGVPDDKCKLSGFASASNINLKPMTDESIKIYEDTSIWSCL